MRCPLETVEAQDLFLPSIDLAEHMDADALVALQTAVLDAELEGTRADIDGLLRICVITRLLHAYTPISSGRFSEDTMRPILPLSTMRVANCHPPIIRDALRHTSDLSSRSLDEPTATSG